MMMALVLPSVLLTAPPPVCVARPASAHARAQRQRFDPPSAQGSERYALAEDGRRAVCKREGGWWTALGGVLGVGEAIRLKWVEKGHYASVGVAPRDAEQAGWMIGGQQGSVGVFSDGLLHVDGSHKRGGLPKWGDGSVIELKRALNRNLPTGTKVPRQRGLRFAVRSPTVAERLDANLPDRERALVRHGLLEPADGVDDIADRPEGPRVGRALLVGERVADADGADDGAVRQVGLGRHARQAREQRVATAHKAARRASPGRGGTVGHAHGGGGVGPIC